jgi:uncharacterized iron-regulated membrane protein
MSATIDPAGKPAKTGKSIWPKVPAPFVRAILAGHSALGLAFAALIFLVCFSGTVVVLLLDVERWESPGVATVGPVTPQAIETVRAEALAKYPGAHHIFASLPTADQPRFNVYIDAVTGKPNEEYTADQNGHLIETSGTPWAEFIQSLHIYLHLPSNIGLFVVGLTGVALLSSLISGVLAHPRVFRDAFHLRWGGAKRLQEADMHNRIGVWGLPFHVMISLTGAFIGLTTILMAVLALATFKGDTIEERMAQAYAFFLPPAPKDDPRPAPLAPLAPMFAQVSRDAPGAEFSYVIFEHPGETGQTVQVQAIKPNALNRGDTWVFDGQGKLLQGGYSDSNATPGNAILQAMSTLHFGWFAGWPVKIAYILLGAGLTAVTASGVAIWLARRRDKGRPAPRWERVWVAFCWSQPPAYAITALVALLTPAVGLVPVWLVVSLLALATALLWSPEQISWRLRLAGAILIAAVPVTHIALHGSSIADPVAWAINAIMLTCAALMGISLLRPLRVRKTAPPIPAE